MAAKDDRLKIRLKLKEHQFLWANISQRSRNTWMAGAFFVPISFLIFAYAATAQNLSLFNLSLLGLASISEYSIWTIFLYRSDKANSIYVKRIKEIEARLKQLGIDFQPLTETDEERKKISLLGYEWPSYLWGALLGILFCCWFFLFLSVRF